jgi:hypothetical protein
VDRYGPNGFKIGSGKLGSCANKGQLDVTRFNQTLLFLMFKGGVEPSLDLLEKHMDWIQILHLTLH